MPAQCVPLTTPVLGEAKRRQGIRPVVVARNSEGAEVRGNREGDDTTDEGEDAPGEPTAGARRSGERGSIATIGLSPPVRDALLDSRLVRAAQTADSSSLMVISMPPKSSAKRL